MICTFVATLLALLAGYFGGWIDWVITRGFDLIAALPVILLGIALGTALAISGFHHGPINIECREPLDPGARDLGHPRRVHRAVAARADPVAAREGVHRGVDLAGRGPLRVMLAELLPNIASTILVFFTLIIANNILVEAALSFLGAGVQPPTPRGDADRGGQDRIRPRRG